MMERRYEAYKNIVVRPFFRDHFARLDRQIVLVDALAALNAGPAALRDLEDALAAILDCFRAGRRSFVSSIFRPRIDRILFAATKADHLHHMNHDRLERILDAHGRAGDRARRVRRRHGRRGGARGGARDARGHGVARPRRPAVDRRHPVAGETAQAKRRTRDVRRHDRGGDVSRATCRTIRQRCSPASGVRGLHRRAAVRADYRFLRFRPAATIAGADGAPALPHIRLDRTLQFLLGDYLA